MVKRDLGEEEKEKVRLPAGDARQKGTAHCPHRG